MELRWSYFKPDKHLKRFLKESEAEAGTETHKRVQAHVDYFWIVPFISETPAAGVLQTLINP